MSRAPSRSFARSSASILDDAADGLRADDAEVFRGYVPPAPLASFVELFWYYEGRAGAGAPARAPVKELILPTGAMQLIVRLGEPVLQIWDRDRRLQVDDRSGSLINGVHARPFVIDTSTQDALLGVQFRIAGAFPFLGVPSCELENAHVRLTELWGDGVAGELRCRLLEAPTVDAKFEVMERHLLAMVSTPLVHHRSVKRGLRVIADVSEATRVGDIAADIGLSQRRFIEVFKQQVGLTPKLYARVRRFQTVISAVGAATDPRWPEIAAACGYFDQAHLIRDFKQFCGLTPGDYARRRGDRRNHVPFDD